MKKVLLLLTLSCLFPLGLYAGENPRRIDYQDCTAYWHGDSLVLQNSRLSRTYRWNNGHLTTLSMENRQQRAIWHMNDTIADCSIPGLIGSATSAELDMAIMTETASRPGHLLITVITHFSDLSVKRCFRLYPHCPAIACDFFLKGSPNTAWSQPDLGSDNIESIEFLNKFDQTPRVPVMERLAPGGRHWRARAVQFYDRTDVNNNLVEEHRVLTFTKWRHLTGNILFADDLTGHHSLFVLKEAPCSDVQLAYPGADFLVRNGEMLCIGLGVTPQDLNENQWQRCYGFVTGVAGDDELSKLQALRSYQDNLRIRRPGRDLMIMMNTWGDRNRDAKLGEAFALNELEAGARLGITHFQLDDGWQSGISKNSAYGEGSWQDNWTRRDYWNVHPEKFPNGLTPVIKRGKELGIEICLWFNPSSRNDYQNWQADADAMIALYKAHGIRTYKLDGALIPSKAAENNFRNMLERVTLATAGEAVFNLDVTAGKRFGYHFFTEYGTIFLENRYTDWANYYPHWTLRNLWMLSRYVPPQSMQIEFLNKYRNQNKYLADDPLAPARIPFEYLFAATMAGQPLAWFEASALPQEAMAIAPVVKTYRDLQNQLHACQIFPLGDEPSGTGWTGFQALGDKHGYFLIFRENNTASQCRIPTWLKPGTKVTCKTVLGQGHDFSAKAGQNGEIEFQLHGPFSYALYRYTHR